MYRETAKSNKSGDLRPVWVAYNYEETAYELFWDLYCKEPVDTDEWELIPIDKEDEYARHPFPMFGIECGSGWNSLLEPIIKYIDDYNSKLKEDDTPIKIMQIKEKFGGLRFYVSYGTEELHDMIDKAEDESYNICETCGTRKDVGERCDVWIETICLDCLKNRCKKNNKTAVWRENSTGKKYIVDGNGKNTELTKPSDEDNII